MVDELPLKDVNVVFQGVEGAYSYAAMRAYFPEEINSYHVKTFRAAMEEVAFGKADYAVLPIENSTEGIVTDIYDLLTEYQLYIVGEQGVRVQHVLLGLPGVRLWMRSTLFILIRRHLHSAKALSGGTSVLENRQNRKHSRFSQENQGRAEEKPGGDRKPCSRRALRTFCSCRKHLPQ